MDKQLLKTKYLKSFVILAVIIIFAVSYLFILNPKYSKMKKGGELDIETKKDTLETKKIKLAELQKLKDAYEKIKSGELEKLTKLLPVKKDIPGIFVQLETIASDNGLTLLSVNISPDSDSANKKKSALPANIEELKSTIRITGGDYAALKKFLNSVENNLRMMDITSLNFSAASNTYTLGFKTYYLAK